MKNKSSSKLYRCLILFTYFMLGMQLVSQRVALAGPPLAPPPASSGSSASQKCVKDSGGRPHGFEGCFNCSITACVKADGAIRHYVETTEITQSDQNKIWLRLDANTLVPGNETGAVATGTFTVKGGFQATSAWVAAADFSDSFYQPENPTFKVGTSQLIISGSVTITVKIDTLESAQGNYYIVTAGGQKERSQEVTTTVMISPAPITIEWANRSLNQINDDVAARVASINDAVKKDMVAAINKKMPLHQNLWARVGSGKSPRL
jgi:hypothetical protein